ncbi:MAG: hypothetical protein V8S42_01845 [Lachnospiraceae bacterium]
MKKGKHSVQRKPGLPGKRRHSGKTRKYLEKTRCPWGYSLPAMILIAMIVLFPILYTGYISLTNMNLYHWTDYSLIGAENYTRALLKVDSGFLSCPWDDDSVDSCQYGAGYGDRLRACRGPQYKGAESKAYLQDAAYFSMGDAGLCFHSGVARGNV